MNRYDIIDAPSYMTSKFEKTPEGYLKGRAAVCSTGVYQYMDGDGNVHGELRLPEEVFNPLFLDSLKLKPLTFNHPNEMVTADNIKKYSVGSLGDNPSAPTGMDEKGDGGEYKGHQFFNTDGYFVSIDMVVQDADVVQKVLNGDARELSVGYTCDIEEKDGVWCGMKYDRIQRNLRANHVSIVPAARGGDALRIRLDSADAVMITEPKEKPMDLKEIKLDGVEYKAEAKVLEALHAANTRTDGIQKKLDEAVAEKSKLEADRDVMKARVDALEKENAELKVAKLDEAVINAAVARRVAILDSARKAGVEVKDGMDEVAIQKAVIQKAFPKIALDGKDKTYIDAVYDGAMQTFVDEVKADAEVRQAAVVDVKTDAKDEVAEARKRMIESYAKVKKE